MAGSRHRRQCNALAIKHAGHLRCRCMPTRTPTPSAPLSPWHGLPKLPTQPHHLPCSGGGPLLLVLLPLAQEPTIPSPLPLSLGYTFLLSSLRRLPLWFSLPALPVCVLPCACTPLPIHLPYQALSPFYSVPALPPQIDAQVLCCSAQLHMPPTSLLQEPSLLCCGRRQGALLPHDSAASVN